jgi:hypothetical protein
VSGDRHGRPTADGRNGRFQAAGVGHSLGGRMTGHQRAVVKLGHSRRWPSRWHLPGVASACTEAERAAGQPFTCPVCGTRVTGPDDVRLGYCGTCGRARPCVSDGFTGLCGAGRAVKSPPEVLLSSWQIPCTSFGAELWLIIVAGSPQRVLLCRAHAAQVRHGQAPCVDGGFGATGEQLAFPRRSLMRLDPVPAQEQGR